MIPTPPLWRRWLWRLCQLAIGCFTGLVAVYCYVKIVFFVLPDRWLTDPRNIFQGGVRNIFMVSIIAVWYCASCAGPYLVFKFTKRLFGIHPEWDSGWMAAGEEYLKRGRNQ